MAGLVVLAAALCEAPSLRGEAVAPVRPARTNLLQFLDRTRGELPCAGTTLELDPHWVGTVKRVHLYDPRAVYRADTPDDLRLTHLVVQEDEAGGDRLALARLRWVPGQQLTFVGREAPAFQDSIPALERFSTATNLAGLFELLGSPDDAAGDGGGGFGAVHWTEEWTQVMRTETNRLRYVNVLAHVSAAARKDGQSPRLNPTNAAVDILVIREGVFRPADPKSAEERQQFLTADGLFTRAQAAQAKARERHPQPLRALIEAQEKPDDFDQAAYTAALQHVRANPDPKLFRQIIAAMNQDEVEFGSYLEDILGDESDLPGLAAWQPVQRQTAVRAVIEALPEARQPAGLEEVLLAILVSQGGGKLKFAVPGTKAAVDLTASKAGDGFAKTHGCDGLSEANLAQVAAHCQTVLKQKYAVLWSKLTQPPGGKSERQ